MRGYVRKKTIDELTKKAVITIGIEFEFDYEDGSWRGKEGLRKYIENYKDQLWVLRVRARSAR